jgi:hypothetical protein
MDIPETPGKLDTQDRPKINKAQIYNRENLLPINKNIQRDI